MAATICCAVLVLLYSIPVTAATTVFHTNCTRPPDGSSFNFVTAPTTRGTLEILWSCLFTLFLCIWQVQHPKVPHVDGKGPYLFGSRASSMFFTMLIGPDFSISQALVQFVQAKRSVRHMQREFPELVQKGGWTMTHAFYANMHGFMVRRRSEDEEEARDVGEPELATNSILADTAASRPVRIKRKDILVLNTERMVIYLKSHPSSSFFMTEADIKRRGTGNCVFVKCIALLQVVWFIVQLCVRMAQSLPITHLEINVLAQVICTSISCVLWIKKPQDVSIPTILDEGPEPLPVSEEWFDSRDSVFSDTHLNRTELHHGLDVAASMTGIILGAALFGAIHLLAWNFHIDADLTFFTLTTNYWRMYAISSTVMPVMLLLLSPLILVGGKIFLICLFVYILLRIKMVEFCFLSLWYLPAGAFATTWPTYMPHLR